MTAGKHKTEGHVALLQKLYQLPGLNNCKARRSKALGKRLWWRHQNSQNPEVQNFRSLDCIFDSRSCQGCFFSCHKNQLHRQKRSHSWRGGSSHQNPAGQSTVTMVGGARIAQSCQEAWTSGESLNAARGRRAS